jgi:ferredoxin-NADP reductase
VCCPRSRGSDWHNGTVVELLAETPRVTSIVVDVTNWPGHRSGQHTEVGFTASDGSRRQRGYWIASAPEDGYVVLTVERLSSLGASSYLCDTLSAGDPIELRGPMGEFAWDPSTARPVLLVADGIGIVPFRSMLRHWVASPSAVAVRLLYSAPSLADVIYYDELLRLAAYDEVDIQLVLTGGVPSGRHSHDGRFGHALVDNSAWMRDREALVFICGSSEFVETTQDLLADNATSLHRVRTDCFDP